LIDIGRLIVLIQLYNIFQFVNTYYCWGTHAH